MTITSTDSLAEQLAAMDAKHEGWHAWASDEPRHLYATRVRTVAEMASQDAAGPRSGSGITLHAETPLMLDMAIAAYEGEVRAVAA